MTVAAALRERDPSRLPGKRQEGWRWTDLRGLLRELPEPSPERQALPYGGPWAAVGRDEFQVVNGRHQFGKGHIRVADGDHPTARLRWIATADAGSHAGQTTVTVGRDASLLLLESYEGQGDSYLAAAELDIRLEPGARLTRLIIADDDADATSVSDATVCLSAGSVFNQTILTTGARRQRIETRVTHPGAGASVRMDGVYVLRNRRHADITTAVAHSGRDGVTSQLTKGVADDQARGVFQGRIEVLHGADGTDARMGHHALILSERAEIDALPQLEIYADDVACSHGNTVGSLDEAALFYARSRGVPEDEARAMLTGAFLGEVIDRIEREDVREVARDWLERQLGSGA